MELGETYVPHTPHASTLMTSWPSAGSFQGTVSLVKVSLRSVKAQAVNEDGCSDEGTGMLYEVSVRPPPRRALALYARS